MCATNARCVRVEWSMMGSEAGRGGRRMDGRVSSPPRVKRCFPFSVDQRCAFFHRRAEVSSSVSCRVVPVEFCLSNARSSGFEKSHDTTFFKNFRLLSEGAGHTSQRPARWSRALYRPLASTREDANRSAHEFSRHARLTRASVPRRQALVAPSDSEIRSGHGS